jgi:hypothetical protein
MAYGRTTAAALIALALASAATAQQATRTGAVGAAPDRAEDPIQVTHDVLERFATVYPVVVALAEEARPRIETAETEPVARAVREQLEDRIILVLAAADFTFSDYYTVVRRLNADEELRAEFQRLLDAAAALAGSG